MNIHHVAGRIIVRVDLEQKNFWTFSDGTTIRLERDYENLDRKYTQQVMGVVIDAAGIPKDALILFHHNSLHETYQVYNHSVLSGEDIASGVKIFSIMERDCFFWKEKGSDTWNPTEGYATAFRVFKPYTGIIQGVEPKLIKNTLWITSGIYKNQCCRTINAVDYQITFMDEIGKDRHIIRCRPDGIEKEGREPEVIAIDHGYTKMINKGELLIGLTPSDCKPLKELSYA